MGRQITELRPSTAGKALKFLRQCKAQKLDMIITCTWRSNEEQASLYAQGRTRSGRIVTNAKPGQSAHNCLGLRGEPASRAFDVVPLRGGKPIWGTSGNGIDADPTDDDTDDLEMWQRVGAVGKACGLGWAGDWRTFREFPHFEEEP